MPLVFQKRTYKLAAMLPRIFAVIAMTGFIALPVSGQVELANLREDVRGLSQRVGELSLRIEQLERENAMLRQSSANLNQSYVTLTQLNAAVNEINATMRAAISNSKSETLQIVGVQMEKLAK